MDEATADADRQQDQAEARREPPTQ